MNGQIDAVVIGAGTSGTFCGVSRAVKKLKRDVLCVLVEPEGSIYGGDPPGPKKVEGHRAAGFHPEDLRRVARRRDHDGARRGGVRCAQEDCQT